MDKKILTLFIAGAMTLSLAACGTKNDTPTETPDTEVTAPVETPDETEKPEATPDTPEETPDAAETPEETPDVPAEITKPEATPAPTPATPSTGSESTDYAQGALDILNKVWGTYTEDEKFPACSGDYNDPNATDGPGIYSIRENDMLNVTFGVPTDYADKIDGVASLVHMMNGNTFTAGVYHLKSGEDVSAFTTALKDNVLARHWMCGFPDTLVVYTVGDYVVSAFGNADLITTFGNKLVDAGATLVSSDSIE